MPSEKMITVDVDKKGGSKIEAHGFSDSTCLKATKSIEEALGAVQERGLKPEASVQATVQQGLRVGSK